MKPEPTTLASLTAEMVRRGLHTTTYVWECRCGFVSSFEKTSAPPENKCPKCGKPWKG